MAQTLAEAVVDIRGRLDNLEKGLRDAEQKTKGYVQKTENIFTQHSARLGQIGRRMAVAITLPVVLLGRKMVMAASDAEEAAAKFRTVFRDEAADVLQWTDAYGKSVNRSRYDLIQWLSALQDTFVPLGYSRKEAAEMSKTLAQLTVDLASFNNLAEADVIQNLISGLMGMHRALYKFGVIITEANIQEEAYRLGLAKTGEELSNQAKVQARLSLIMKGTKDAQGDAVRTADSFENRLRALGAATKDLSVSLGNLLKEDIRPLVEQTRKAAESINDLSDSKKRFALRATEAAGALPLFLTGLAAIGNISDWVKRGLRHLAEFFLETTKASRNTAFSIAVLKGGLSTLRTTVLSTAGIFTTWLAVLPVIWYHFNRIGKEIMGIEKGWGKLVKMSEAQKLKNMYEAMEAGWYEPPDKARERIAQEREQTRVVEEETAKQKKAKLDALREIERAMADEHTRQLMDLEEMVQSWIDVGAIQPKLPGALKGGAGYERVMAWARGKAAGIEAERAEAEMEPFRKREEAIARMMESWMTPFQMAVRELGKQAEGFLAAGVSPEFIREWFAREQEKARLAAMAPLSGVSNMMQPPQSAQWIGGPEQIWKRAMAAEGETKQWQDNVLQSVQRIEQRMPVDNWLRDARFD